MGITTSGGVMTSSNNPSKEELIERYTNEVKHGKHLNNLINAMLDELATLISFQTGVSAPEIKERIFRKAGEVTVSSQGHHYFGE